MKGRALGLLILILCASGLRAAQMVSVDVTGTNAGGTDLSEQFCISGTGRLAAFASRGSNYVAGDTNGIPDIFIYDCQARTNVWNTTGSRAAVDGSIGSIPLAFTPEGRFFLFASGTTNLVPGVVFPPGETLQLYVRDLVSNVTTLVTVAADGSNVANASVLVSGGVCRISPDGRYVTFSSPATNLVSIPDNNGGADLFCRDLLTGTTQLITASIDGAAALDRPVVAFYISTNSRYASFITSATNVVPGLPNTNGFFQLYWRDRIADTNIAVGVSFGGAFLNDASLHGMSMDGRYVCFATTATNVVPGLTDTNRTRDFFVRDMVAGDLWVITRNTNGVTTGSRSSGGKFSDNGEWFLFSNSAGDLIDGVTNNPGGVPNIYAHHLPSRTNAMISISYDGHSGSIYGATDGFSRISATGRYVIFIASGANLAQGTPDKAQRLFLRDTAYGYTRALLEYQPFVMPAYNEARLQISDDERWILFLSNRNYDLSVTKTNNTVELFRVPLFNPFFTTHTGTNFALTALAGHTYVLQFSPDLASWSPIATNIAAADGTVTWIIPTQSTAIRRFYRTFWP